MIGSLQKFRMPCSLILGTLFLMPARVSSADGGETIPKPAFDGIDYAKPSVYLRLDSALGNADHVRKIAAEIKGATAEEKLIAISRWLETNLSFDPNCAYHWRNFDQIVQEAKYGGCADQALVFGALTRACGIPCVWVKTMDIDWIREFRANHGRCSSWRGHVFLEVSIGNRWLLLDAAQMILYDNYRTSERILPGSRYAYDKGGNAYDLVLSTRWEDWKKQTAAAFADFDISTLPLSSQPGNNLRDRDGVFVAADAPVYKWLVKRCADLGYGVRMSFNADFGRILPRSKGAYLIVTRVGERLIMDDSFYDAYMPWSRKELQSLTEHHAHGILKRTAGDGTKVFFIYGKDREAIQRAVNEFTVDTKSAEVAAPPAPVEKAPPPPPRSASIIVHIQNVPPSGLATKTMIYRAGDHFTITREEGTRKTVVSGLLSVPAAQVGPIRIEDFGKPATTYADADHVPRSDRTRVQGLIDTARKNSVVVPLK